VKYRGLVVNCVILGMGIAVTADLYAQAVLEEVLVTARKRVENLQEVPIAVTAFSEADIESARIQRPADFIGLIPNVTLVDAANVGDTQVSIRGIVSTRDAEGTFAYIVDGVLRTNPNAFNEELVDVEHIEVLKGPQGALYGRNAVAGAILVNTKMPGDSFEGKARLSYGNNNSWNGSAVLSGPLTDNIGARFTAYRRETNGFYKNSFSGKDNVVDYLEDTGVRGRIIWNPSDEVSVDFRGGYSKVSGGAINFNAVFAIPAFVPFLGSEAFFADVNEHDFTFAFNVPGENKQKTTNLAIKADWEMDKFNMTAIAAYNNLDEYLLSDGTSATFYGYELTPACQNDRLSLNSFTRPDLFGPPLAPFLVLPPGSAGGADFAGVYGPYTPTSCDGYQYQERNQEDLSFELRLTSPEDQRLRWIAGIYGLDINREVVVAYGADTNSGFLRQPYVPPSGPNPTDLLFHDKFSTKVFAIFGQVEFDITDSMELALAVRYDNEKRKVSNRVPNVLSSGLNINLAGQPINPAFNQFPGGIPDRSKTFSETQPKITWTWKAMDNINVYASWGRGFRSGGFNSIGSEATIDFWYNAGFGGPGELVNSNLTINDEYAKEVTDSLEIGSKMNFMNNRLQVNAALFSTTIDNNQFFEFFAGPFGLMRVVTTIDKLEMQGFELDVNFAATENLRLFGSLGLLDSKIKKNTNRPLSVGNDAPQAPRKTYNLGAQYDMPIGRGLNFIARVDYQYVGAMWFHTLQGEEVPTIWQVFFGPGLNSNMSKARRDSFATVDARIGITGEYWDLVLWGRNLTDEHYLQEVIPAPEFGGSFIHPSGLRSYGVEATYRF